MKLIFIFGVIHIISSVTCTNLRVDPLVLVNNQGLVRGQKASDGDYSSFLGIPYAKVDENNPFGSSLPAPVFEDVFKAYDGSIACPQTNSNNAEGQLDCLTLNIHVPYEASSKNPLPVFVWIHGGGFNSGKAGDYAARNLVRHGIIFVSINYRLGPYGFLCLDIPSVPGNQGLKDQLTALRWIKQNIAAFGGNPYNITLGGQSAGGISVDHHLNSKHEKLFHKVIMQSGVADVIGSFANSGPSSAFKLSEYLGFNTTNIDSALNFLTKSSPSLVTAASKDLDLVLLPCKEKSFEGQDNFLENYYSGIINGKKLKNTPVIIGVTSKEGYGAVSSPVDIADVLQSLLAHSFNYNDEQFQKAVDIVRHFYFGDDANGPDAVSKLEDFASDFMYDHPIHRKITSLVEYQAGPIYEYVFNYVSDNDQGDRSTNSAPHTADLKYLFSSNSLEDINDEEALIVDRITTLWANFVKYGNPTANVNEIVPIKWEAVNDDKRPYLTIGTEIAMDSRPKQKSMAFWDLLYTLKA